MVRTTSAIVVTHPQAKYFNIGRVGRDRTDTRRLRRIAATRDGHDLGSPCECRDERPADEPGGAEHSRSHGGAPSIMRRK